MILAKDRFFTPAAAHGAALLLFALPLFAWFPAVDSFILPKWFLLAAGGALLFALAAGASARRAPLRLALTPVNGLLLAFTAWMAIAVAWAPSSLLAWEELRRWLLALGVALLIQSIATDRRDRVLLLLAGVRWSSLAVSLWALAFDFLQAFSPGTIGVKRTLGDWRDTISAVALGNSGHVGDFLGIGFLAWAGVWLLARRPVHRWIAAVALWLHAAALIVAWSVHSNLALIVGCGVALLLLRGTAGIFGQLLRRIAPLAIGFAVVIAFFVVNHPFNPHGRKGGGALEGIFAEAFSSPRWKEGGPTRLAIWYTTAAIVADNPVLGAGTGSFTYVYPDTISARVANDARLSMYAATWTNAAHNEPLQFWAELGIVGLMLLLMAVAAAFHAFVRARRNQPPGNRVLFALGAGALAALCVQSTMSFPLQLPVSTLLFLLLLGLPAMVPPRGDAINDRMLVRLDRHAGPLRIRIAMENMQIPRELGIGFAGPAWLAPVIALSALGFCAPGVWRAFQHLRADVAYREVRALVLTGIDSVNIDEPASRVIALWPAHIDCRSAWSETLLRRGEFARSLEQTELVLRGLNATEVHLRRALALEGLDRSEEAVASWDVVFARRPDLGRSFPAQFHQFLERHRPPA